MAGRFKFVSVALMITLFASEVAALSACWIPMPTMQEMTMGDEGLTASMSPSQSAAGNQRVTPAVRYLQRTSVRLDATRARG